VLRRAVSPTLLVPLLLAVSSFAERPAVPRALTPPSAAEILDHAVTLTGPDMAGRGSATPGGDRAAQRIGKWLAEAGLQPGGEHGTFVQPFTISTGTRLASGTSLETIAPDLATLETGRQWTPHGGSKQGEVTADVVFVGYGISLPEHGYDDYAGIDPRGALVLVLAGGPPHLAAAPMSRLEKLIAARAHGAAAVLLVGDALPTLDATGTHVALLSGTVTPAAADTLLAPTGRTVAALRTAIIDTRRPLSLRSGVTARLRVALETEERRAANVIGIIPGTDPARASEAVVIGAHYDHLGTVNGTTYPGADDNASGTAVVVALARAFAAAAATHPPARTLVFALFSGEELGLLGSEHYVSHPARPLARTVAMLNFDQVGRLRAGRLQVGGVDSAAGLRQIVAGAAAGTGVDVVARGTPFAPSDHTRFYDAGVPVLFFYTGTHDDHHAPTDTADRLNAEGMARVATIGGRVIERLADDPARPVYAKVARPERPPARGVRNAAFFGAAPAAHGGDGLRLERVVAGSAAARAGMRAGDVIVRFAGASIESFEALRAALRDKRPGDTVRVVYLRGGAIHDTSATLGEP
jgi:hypothetical protein